jgi:hypothetical protein
MLPFGVTILATVQQRLEILEGLMNYPVYINSNGIYKTSTLENTWIMEAGIHSAHSFK